jgi:hypothetical protein
MNVLGYEKVTISNAVKQLTVAEYSDVDTPSGSKQDAQEAFVTVEATNGFRYTFDGTAPEASTTGHLAAGSSSFTIIGFNAIQNFKAIREGGSDAVIHVTYFAGR